MKAWLFRLSLIVVVVLAGPPSLSLAASSAGETPAGRCGDNFTSVSQIQGADDVSPLAGDRVIVEGVVTAAFPGRDRLSGFYLMSAPADADADNATSEGLFIHLPRKLQAQPEVTPGQRVRLEGRVKEYHGLTELTSVSHLIDCRTAPQTLAPTRLAWPLENLESLEGMLVVVEPLHILDQHMLPRFGVLRLGPERLSVPTQVVDPGARARARAAENENNAILLDDGSNRTYPGQTYRVPGRTSGTGNRIRPLRLGDLTRAFHAIVDYRYGDWRLQPLGQVGIEPGNPRPAPPTPTDGLRLAGFNLENFFNGDGQGDGFPGSRGARTQADYLHQKARIVAALELLDADIVAVSELENDGFGPNSASADLAGSLGPEWAFVDFSRAGTGKDAITNGIFYRRDHLENVGTPAALTTGIFAGGNRPPLAAAFQGAGMAEPVVVVANHFKSKRCGKPRAANKDQGNGEGCWSALRSRAAAELLAWLQTDPTATMPKGSVLVGDFNSYRRESPMDILRAAGFHNPATPESYSYVYDGQRGTLDYTWVSDRLKGAVVGAGVWHGNADEGPAGGPGEDPQSGPWGASDHDPVWVDLRYEIR